MTMKATKLAAILSRLHSAWRLPQATLALALAIAALASPARAAAGDIPSGYTPIPDSDHNGGLYKAALDERLLVTDYYPNEKTWMEIEVKFDGQGRDDDRDKGGNADSKYSYFMGCVDMLGSESHGCMARNSIAGNALHFRWSDGSVTEDPVSFNNPAIQSTLILENGKVTWNGEIKTIPADATVRTEGSSQYPVTMFGCTFLFTGMPYQSRNMTVYSWKIYESDNGQKDGPNQQLVRDFRPVSVDGTDKKGLYDVEKGNFFLLYESTQVDVDFADGYSAVLKAFGEYLHLPYELGGKMILGVASGVELPDLPEDALPTKSGKKLMGFFDKEEGGTQYYNANGMHQKTCDDDLIENKKLYAQWGNFQYGMEYELNGGSYPVGTRPVTKASYGNVVRVFSPERKGYRFTGWQVTEYEPSCAQYSLSEGGELVNLNTPTGNITCDGDIWVKNLRGENDENTVTMTAQWEIALPPEYEKLDCLDNGSDISTAGFVQVTGFQFGVKNAVALTYCINDTTYQWQNLFFSHHIENGGSRTEFGLCYPNLSSEDPMSFHHGIDDRAGSIQNAGVSDKNVTNTLVLAETGSTFNGSPISFGGTQPSSLTGRSLPNDLLIFCSDDKAYSDGYPYNDSGSLCGLAFVKIFSFKVMANGADSEVILDLVPAKRKAGDVEGFYDVVNGGFYPLRHRCASPTEIASHAVETWQEKAATESECGYKCGVCTDCLMRISQMILPTQPTRSWPYDGANHKPTISNTNDVMEKAGCTVTYSPAGEWKTVGTDYKATYALTPGHVWSDGTTEAKTISYSISPAPIMVTAPDVVGYEGSPTQITVKVTAPATGYTITYSETEDGEYTADNPSYSEFGVYRVYWKVTAASYEETKGSSLVSIAKKAAGEYVRLVITKCKGGGNDNDFQFNELELYDDEKGTTPITSGLTLATGLADLKDRAGTCYSFPTNCYGDQNAQNASKLFDNDAGKGSKLCCLRNSTSADSTDAHVEIYMHLSDENASKVIRSYNLKSADDAQNCSWRSPTAWRLEVSSDCERWTVIDEKTVADTAGNTALFTKETWYGRDGSGNKKPYPINLNYVPMEVLETNPYEGTEAYKAERNYVQIVGFQLEADDVVTTRVRYNDTSLYDVGGGYWDTLFSQRSLGMKGNFAVYRQITKGNDGTSADYPHLRIDYGDDTDNSREVQLNGKELEFVASATGLVTNGVPAIDASGGTWNDFPNNSLLLFASDESSKCDGVPTRNSAYLKCHYFQVADSTAVGSPLRLDLVPASNTVSHAQGLYDRVSGNFYPLQEIPAAGKTAFAPNSPVVTFSKELTAVMGETGWNQFPLVTEVTNRVGYLTTITNYWQQEWVPAEVTGPGEYRQILRGQGPYKGAVTNFYTVCASVTLSPNGGTAGTTNRVLALPGKVLPAITGVGALPTNPGCLFLGYWTEAEGGVKYYNADGTSAMEAYPVTDAPTTLYAHWLEGYEPLAKLNFDGTHFILTDYVPISNTWIETEMQAMGNRVSGSAALFGFFEKLRGEAVESVYGFNAELATSGSGLAVYGWVLGVNSNSGGRGRMWWGNNGWSYLANKCKVQFGYTGFTMSDGSTTISGEVRPDIKFDMDNCFPCHTALVIGGYNGAVPSGAGSPGYGTPVRPYSLTDGGLDVYSFKIYESANGDPADAEQTLVHNFIPVTRTGDGKEGFYDVVGQKFYPLKTETVVTLDRNGGNNLETNYVYAIAGEALPTVTEIPKKAGHAFAGYFTAASDGTKYYNADGTCVEGVTYPDEGGPAMLYAQWEADKYHVINPENGPEIVVNYEWLTNAYGSGKSKAEYQQKLFTTNQYGVVNWQAYILGYEPDELEMAAILEESVQNTHPETVTIRLRDWEEREAKMRADETGCTLRYTLLSARTPGELMTGGGTVVTNLEMTAEFLKWPEWSFEAPLRDLSDKEPVNYYRIKVHFIFGGGGEGETIFAQAAVTFGEDGWAWRNGDDVKRGYRMIQMPDGFDGGWLRLQFTSSVDNYVGYQYLTGFDKDGNEVLLIDSTDGSVGSWSFCDGLFKGENRAVDRAYYVPSGLGITQFRLQFTAPSGDEQLVPGTSVSNVSLSEIDEQTALDIADANFGTFKSDWDRAIATFSADSLYLPVNVPNLKTALRSATARADPFRVAFVGDSILWDAINGQLEALIGREFPNANIEIVPKIVDSSNAAKFLSLGMDNLSLENCDCVIVGGVSLVRYYIEWYSGKFEEGKTAFKNDMSSVMTAMRNKGCEIVVMPAFLSVDSRSESGVTDANYWNSTYISSTMGQSCAVVDPIPTDNWWLHQRCLNSEFLGFIKTICGTSETKACCCDMTSVVTSFLFGSGRPVGWHNRDSIHNNEYGKQFNARLIVECLKAIRDSAD